MAKPQRKRRERLKMGDRNADLDGVSVYTGKGWRWVEDVIPDVWPLLRAAKRLAVSHGLVDAHPLCKAIRKMERGDA